MPEPSRWIILIISLIFSIFTAMAESSFSYLNQFKIKVMESEGKKSASLVLKTLDKFDKYIIDVLILTNIAHILTSVMATVLTINILISTGMSAELSNEYGTIISTIITTIVVFFCCELIPKAIAKVKADEIICVLIYPMTFFGYVLYPVSLIFRGLIKLTKLIFKTKEDPIITEDDFQGVIEDIEEDGIIEDVEGEIIQSAVEFDDMKVKEVMCPRENIVAYDISLNLNRDQLIDFICDNNFTRIPVYDGSIDNIIGILHTRTLLKELMLNNPYDIKSILTDPIIVHPNVHIDTIFEEFKKERNHIAIVKDKDDNTIGLVTMEDVIEELIGDIDESNEGVIENE